MQITTNINWLNSLSGGFKSKLISIAKRQKISPSDHLALHELPSTGVTYFCDGSAVVTMQTPNLKTINNMVFTQGNWFGDYQPAQQDNFSLTFSVWAPITVIHFENTKLKHLIDDCIETYSWLYHISLASRPKWLQAQLLSAENKRIRTAYMLLEFLAHNIQDSENKLSISQQALSDMIGISRQRVNEVLIEFQSNGCIYLERNSIQITNAYGLAKLLNGIDLSFRNPCDHIDSLI